MSGKLLKDGKDCVKSDGPRFADGRHSVKGANLLIYKFFSAKLHENEDILASGGGTYPLCPLDPPLVNYVCAASRKIRIMVCNV